MRNESLRLVEVLARTIKVGEPANEGGHGRPLARPISEYLLLFELRTPVIGDRSRRSRFGHRMLRAPAVHAARTAREEDSASQGDLRVTECEAEPFQEKVQTRGLAGEMVGRSANHAVASAPVDAPAVPRLHREAGPEAPHRVRDRLPKLVGIAPGDETLGGPHGRADLAFHT